VTEVLKQPLETAIALHTEDFEDFHMQEDMHIVISVRDFKAIVTHAETLRGSITASFSAPTKPLQFSYQASGLHCEFTLMTSGDNRSDANKSTPAFVSTRSTSRQASAAPQPALSAQDRSTSEMPPPARPNGYRPFGSQSQGTSLGTKAAQRPVAKPDQDPESLFLPTGDDDATWEPQSFDAGAEEEMLGWDATNEHSSASFRRTFRDSVTAAPSQYSQRPMPSLENDEGLEPTQRLSQVGAGLPHDEAIADCV